MKKISVGSYMKNFLFPLVALTMASCVSSQSTYSNVPEYNTSNSSSADDVITSSVPEEKPVAASSEITADSGMVYLFGDKVPTKNYRLTIDDSCNIRAISFPHLKNCGPNTFIDSHCIYAPEYKSFQVLQVLDINSGSALLEEVNEMPYRDPIVKIDFLGIFTGIFDGQLLSNTMIWKKVEPYSYESNNKMSHTVSHYMNIPFVLGDNITYTPNPALGCKKKKYRVNIVCTEMDCVNVTEKMSKTEWKKLLKNISKFKTQEKTLKKFLSL